jgi:hypothetical protein
MTDSRYHMRSTKSSLLHLRKEFIGVSVQLQLSDEPNWEQFFRPDFGSIQNVKFKVVLSSLWTHLNTELPYRKDAMANGFREISPVEIRVLASFGDIRLEPRRPRSRAYKSSTLHPRRANALQALAQSEISRMSELLRHLSM